MTALSGFRPGEDLASPEPRSSAGLTFPPGFTVTPGLTLTPELQLDAAEHGVVSMFVGAGLVSAGTATRLRARRESVQLWATAREVC